MSMFKKIKGLAKSDGMPERLALLIAAQCAHETAYFTSNVYKTCNNLNGYKYAGSKWQISACTDSPEGNAYGKYASWQDSVHELTDWIKRRLAENRFPYLQDIRTPEMYAKYLKKCGYFGDTAENYARGMSHAIERYA